MTTYETKPQVTAFEAETLPEELGLGLWSSEFMTDEFEAESIRSLMEENGNPEEKFGVYIIDGKDPRSSLGRKVELERFDDEFGNGPDYMKKLYGEFEDFGLTQLLVVVDHENLRAAGVIRLVRNTAEHGCRILNDLQLVGENGWGLSTLDEVKNRADFAAETPEEILDIPTIAVSKDYGSKLTAVSDALCAGVFQTSLKDGITKTWVCSLARIPYIIIQEKTGNAFYEFAGVPSAPYHGDTDTTPLWCNLDELFDMTKSNDPSRYQKYYEGVGLEDYFFAV